MHADVAATLLKLVQAGPHQKPGAYDVIALATHGRSGFKRAWLGRVTEHVFGATSLPLFVVCPSAIEVEHHAVRPTTREDQPTQGPVGLL